MANGDILFNEKYKDMSDESLINLIKAGDNHAQNFLLEDFLWNLIKELTKASLELILLNLELSKNIFIPFNNLEFVLLTVVLFPEFIFL